jgi:AcrR family transcriptional regulator
MSESKDLSSHKKDLSSPLRVSPEPVPKIGKSERTRAAILNAAFDFLWSRPFREMTVNSLMASTGLSRSAFYQYFTDQHDLMKALLGIVQKEISEVIGPWIVGVGDPVALIHQSLDGLVRVTYERGPFMRAIFDAASADKRLEEGWSQFLESFDEGSGSRIEADQKQGLIPDFDVRPVIFALNRLDAYTIVEAFGQHPRREPGPVRDAFVRIWVSTLYGSEWLDKGSSTLVRT